MKPCILLFIFLYTTNLPGQGYPTYRLYNLEEFCREHVGDQETFMEQFYTEARYNALAREYSLEGKFEVMLLNHSDSSFEVFVNTHYQFFTQNIYATISVMRKKWIKTDIAFMVNFCIEYKLVYVNGQERIIDPDCPLQVIAYAIHEIRDTSYIFNAREITVLPKITGYPAFIKTKRVLRKYALDSIESLVEAAIKSCCRKNIRLTHQQPSYHAQTSYPTPKGQLSIVFHSKGYISQITLLGQLKERVDEVALLNSLQGFRFVPAQFKSVRAHLVLEYRME